jgi:hypothetical protein
LNTPLKNLLAIQRFVGTLKSHYEKKIALAKANLLLKD